MENYWIIISPILIALGGLAYRGMKSFIGEKLKNIATQQDISKITNEVESVKQIFTTQTEKLKQELSVLTNRHNILFTEEKEALLAYLSAWNMWYSKLEKMVAKYNINVEYRSNDDVLRGLDKLNEENHEEDDRIQICTSKLELFMTNDEIIKSVYALNSETYQIQVLNEEYIYSYMHYSCYSNFLMNEHKIAEKENNGLQKEIMNTLSEKIKDSKVKENEYDANLKERFKKVVVLKNEFIRLSKEHIRKGLEA